MASKILIVIIAILLILVCLIIWLLSKSASQERIKEKPSMSGYEGDTMFVKGKK